jgi:hypothetical protein
MYLSPERENTLSSAVKVIVKVTVLRDYPDLL